MAREYFLEPGDVLLIPKGWWQWHISQNENVAVTFVTPEPQSSFPSQNALENSSTSQQPIKLSRAALNFVEEKQKVYQSKSLAALLEPFQVRFDSANFRRVDCT